MPTPNVSETIPSTRSRSAVKLGLALVIFTIILRSGVILGLRGELTDDIDGYLAIAQECADGNGFVNPKNKKPTAFRPPLYPLLLAGWLTIGPVAIGIAVLHIVLAAGTVWLTFLTGLRLGLSKSRATLAGGLIACDPLLARYAALPMTETLATFLAVSLLYLSFGSSRKQQLLRGVCFGLAVLCRPTFWVFGGLALLDWTLNAWRSRRSLSISSSRNPIPWATFLAISVIVLPWVIRNTIAFGKPVLMTTHGGYTLLLGNNPTFAQEVVQQPFGAVWDGDSLQRWQKSLEKEMQAEGISADDELARDRYLRDRAIHFIRSEPGTFLQACWLRFRRFWGVSPPATAAESIGRLWTRFTGNAELVPVIQTSVRWSVRVFYGVLFAAAFWSGCTVMGRSEWWPAFWLIGSLMLVHLVYWSNARMRAPTLPAITLLAASVLKKEQSLSASADEENAG